MEEPRIPGDGEDELVPVLVPRHHLAAVYEYLGKLLASPSATIRPLRSQPLLAQAEPNDVACQYCGEDALWVAEPAIYQCTRCGLVFRAAVTVDGDNGTWTKPMVEELKARLESEIARSVLDTIARKAPGSVAYDDLLKVTNANPNHLRAELAALSKLTRRLFGRRTWPMTAKQGWGGGDRMGYRMPKEVAEWWLSA